MAKTTSALILFFFSLTTPARGASSSPSLGSCLKKTGKLVASSHKDAKSGWRDVHGPIDLPDYGLRAYLSHQLSKAVHVSEETRAAMEGLVQSGGLGEYVRFTDVRNVEGAKGIIRDFGEGKDVLRILSPPRKKIYTDAFDEVFREFDRAGVPVFIDPHMSSDAYAYITFSHKLSPSAQAAVFFRPQLDRFTLRHELQHLRDFKTHIDEFQRELPELPNSILEILKKRSSGKKLGRKEERKYGSVVGLMSELGEVRASGGSVKSLFTAKGFKEVWLSQNRGRDLNHYLQEVLLSVARNGRLLYYSLLVDPGNPKNLVILAKLAVVGGGTAFLTASFIEFRIREITYTVSSP